MQRRHWWYFTGEEAEACIVYLLYLSPMTPTKANSVHRINSQTGHLSCLCSAPRVLHLIALSPHFLPSCIFKTGLLLLAESCIPQALAHLLQVTTDFVPLIDPSVLIGGLLLWLSLLSWLPGTNVFSCRDKAWVLLDQSSRSGSGSPVTPRFVQVQGKRQSSFLKTCAQSYCLTTPCPGLIKTEYLTAEVSWPLLRELAILLCNKT